MRALDYKVGVAVVIKCNRWPIVGYMAGFAHRTKMTIMVVFLEVTRDAGCFQRVGKRVLTVTIGASELCMPAIQRELGVPVMIETRVEPVRRSVAILAIPPTAAVVSIILLVTSEAGGRGQGERVVRMAIQAGDLPVLAEQRVAGSVVIEFDLLPIGGRMAVRTGFTKIAFVHVIVSVAIKALVRCFPKFLTAVMTARTFHVGMLSLEKEISHSVIKGSLLQHYDRRISAFMLRVTCLALFSLGSGKQAVIPPRLLDVCCDIIVTFGTPRILAFLFERSMTRRAFTFDIRVSLNHFARHDQFLNFNCSCCGKGELHQHNCHTNQYSIAYCHRTWRCASVHMHGEHVHKRCQHHDQKYWQMKNMPQ